MRYIRIAVSVLFIMSIVFIGGATVVQRIRHDSTLPVISGPKEPLMISCNYTEEELLEGLKAYDEKDGDLTDEIMVSNFSRLLKKGSCKVNYVVFDSSNQPATFSREVIFTDYRSPEILLSRPLVFQKNSGESIFSYIGAQDVLDGDISSLVRITDSNVNMLEAGDYSVKIEVTNSFGDTVEHILPVHILELVDSKVSIKLTENIIYLKAGAAFDPSEYVESVSNTDGTELDKSIVKYDSSMVKANTPGIYEVFYTAEQHATAKGFTALTVIVE